MSSCGPPRHCSTGAAAAGSAAAPPGSPAGRGPGRRGQRRGQGLMVIVWLVLLLPWLVSRVWASAAAWTWAVPGGPAWTVMDKVALPPKTGVSEATGQVTASPLAAWVQPELQDTS